MENDNSTLIVVLGGETTRENRENEHSTSVEIIGANGLCRLSGVLDLPEARGKMQKPLIVQTGAVFLHYLGLRLSTGVPLQQSVYPEESSLLVEQLEMMLSNSWIGRSGKQHPNVFSQMSAVCRIITKLQMLHNVLIGKKGNMIFYKKMILRAKIIYFML